VTNNGAVEAFASAGYSLAELMIVITCSAILLAAAAPNVVQLQREWTLWGSARVLEAALQWGRMHAISSNSSLLFEVDVNQQKFFWADPESGDPYDGSVRYLSRGVHVISCPSRPLRFYQHGNAAPAGTYTLEGETGSYSVVVSPGGRIRIQRN
jgi:Tfp pilus assembly protein FimT